MPSGQTLCGVHGNRANRVLTQVLGDLEHQTKRLAGLLVGVGRFERAKDRWQMAVEFHIDNGADDLDDAPGGDAGRKGDFRGSVCDGHCGLFFS